MSIKLVAIDLDGTLLDYFLKISEENIAALKKVKSRGIEVVIATGRDFADVLALTEGIDLSSPIILQNGALIRHPQTGEIWFKEPLWKDLSIKTIELARSFSIASFIHTEDEIKTDEDRGKLFDFIADLYVEITEGQVNPENAKDISLKWVSKYTFVEDIIEHCDENVLKVTLLGRPEVLQKFLAKAQDELGDKVYLTNSFPILIETLSAKASKGKALKYLSERMGIKRDEILAIGDGSNDKDMLEFAGISIAMANCREELRKIADYITLSCEDNGVAKALEKFVL
ncbi:MAG: Cof-type HAD-IIB family hydrolase [Actinobacteria bacterium]|nr:Cof-type HAD-IIB family hydrolase [Actinomycetota bacterium]